MQVQYVMQSHMKHLNVTQRCYTWSIFLRIIWLSLCEASEARCAMARESLKTLLFIIEEHRKLMRYEQRAVNQIRKAARIEK